MPSVDINPVSGLLRHRTHFPDIEAIVYGDDSWDYRRLVSDVEHLATALTSCGVVRGDRVAYLGLNSPTFLTAMFATWWIGAVFEPLNFRLAPGEVLGLLEQSTPAVVVIEPSHQDVVDTLMRRDGASDSAGLLILVDNDPQVPAPDRIPDHYARLTAVLEASTTSTTPEVLPALEDDLAVLMFTSGTTGVPKGVQLTHGNLWWNSVNVDSLVDTRRGDTTLAVAPLFHIGGLNALTLRTLVRGGRVVIRRTFDPRQTLRDIEQCRINQAFMVPAMLSAMQATANFEEADLSSLRALICAGAPVSPVLLRQYEVKGVAVQQAWGLTETAPFATYLPSELTYVKPGSCGLPMPYTEVRIVDPDTGKDTTNPGDTGEMWVKGPNVTAGYWKNAEATEAAFSDGWFRSDDIGYRDQDGYFYIVDRLKDMIITGGENVYPAEVERALMEYPGLLDAAVVGIEDPEWGQSVAAVVVCQEGVAPTLEDIRDFAAESLARYKLPRLLVTTGTMPRNGSGKLDKPAIRSLVEGHELNHVWSTR